MTCYLVNAPLDDADNSVVTLVQEAFCKALHMKIKAGYPNAVKQLKYAQKFRKVSQRMLAQLQSSSTSAEDLAADA